jgi:septal ring factor EnvC (AmiA/AmiB activator)
MNVRFPAALRPLGLIAIGMLAAFPLAGLFDQPVSAQSPQAALEARLARMEGSFAALQSSHQQLQNAHQQLQNAHQQTVAAIAAVNTRLAGMQSELQKLGARAAAPNPNLQASISPADWSALKTEVQGLQTTVNKLPTEINGVFNEFRIGLQHELAPIKTQVQALQTSVGTFNSGNAADNVAALAFRMAAVETNGQNMGSKLDTVIATDQSIGSKLDTLLANTTDVAYRLYMTCIRASQAAGMSSGGGGAAALKSDCSAAGLNPAFSPFVPYGQPK